MSFDSRKFRRGLEQAAADSVKTRLQPVLDRLRRDCKGQPLANVKRRLVTDWRRATVGSITDPDLTRWATALSEGQRIVLK